MGRLLIKIIYSSVLTFLADKLSEYNTSSLNSVNVVPDRVSFHRIHQADITGILLSHTDRAGLPIIKFLLRPLLVLIQLLWRWICLINTPLLLHEYL